MPFYEDIKTISGNLVVDGTLESKHIKTDSLEANKFKGATEEEYYNFFDDTAVGFNSLTVVHEFDFPSTELDLVKGRHIKVEYNAKLATGTSGTVSPTVTMQTEIKVPDAPSYRGIGLGYHVSFPSTGMQRIEFDGNVVNRFGCGNVGTLSSYRLYRNLHFRQNVEQTELVQNPTFSGISNWVASGGSLSSYFGTAASIEQDSNADEAYFYQAVTVEIGKKYRFSGLTYTSAGTSPAQFHLSTSSSVADAFESSSVFSASSGNQTYTKDFIATTTTVYIMGEATSATNSQYAVFDNFTLKELQDKTYVDVSTASGQIVPTGGSALVYHHPFGATSAGDWAVVDTRQISYRTVPYTHYLQMTSEVYLGAENITYECRLRIKHLAFGDTLTTEPSKVLMQSRMIGEQST